MKLATNLSAVSTFCQKKKSGSGNLEKNFSPMLLENKSCCIFAPALVKRGYEGGNFADLLRNGLKKF